MSAQPSGEILAPTAVLDQANDSDGREHGDAVPTTASPPPPTTEVMSGKSGGASSSKAVQPGPVKRAYAAAVYDKATEKKIRSLMNSARGMDGDNRFQTDDAVKELALLATNLVQLMNAEYIAKDIIIRAVTYMQGENQLSAGRALTQARRDRRKERQGQEDKSQSHNGFRNGNAPRGLVEMENQPDAHHDMKHGAKHATNANGHSNDATNGVAAANDHDLGKENAPRGKSLKGEAAKAQDSSGLSGRKKRTGRPRRSWSRKAYGRAEHKTAADGPLDGASGAGDKAADAPKASDSNGAGAAAPSANPPAKTGDTNGAASPSAKSPPTTGATNGATDLSNRSLSLAEYGIDKAHGPESSHLGPAAQT